MTRTLRILSLAAVAAFALSTAASAQPRYAPWHTAWSSLNNQQMRALHPITQGGTTGGTVNPGINGDHQQHGYNGG
jgi:hypothetical protein